MICKQCGAEFEGKFCPECGARAETAAPAAPSAVKLEYPTGGQDFPPVGGKKPKKKKPFFLRWWFILLVVIALGAAIGSLRSRKADNAPPTAGISQREEPRITPAPQKTAAPESPAPAEEEPAAEEPAEEDDSSLDPHFKAAMDSYEAFIDEYIAFMKKYEASDGTDLSLFMDYADYMSQYAEFADDFAKWEEEDMTTAETSYYIEVQARVAQKLLEVAG